MQLLIYQEQNIITEFYHYYMNRIRQHQNLIIYILLLLSLGIGTLEVIVNLRNETVSDATQSIWGFVFIFLSILWVYADSKQKGFHKPFEFGFLTYVLWPVVFPWYLIVTRGIEGLVLFFGFLLLWLDPWLLGIITYTYFTN